MADDAIRDGFNVRELIDDVLENSDQPSDVEIELIGRYVAGKEAEIRRINEEIEEAAENGDDLNPLMIERDRAVAELNDAYNAARSGGTETARALRYRRQVRAEDESLAAMFLREAASSGVNRLTPEQIEKITQQHKELMDAKTKYEKKIRNLEAQNRRLRADKNVQETKRNTSKKQNKTKEDFKKERLSILEEIKKKWKQAGNDGTLSALPLPYVKQWPRSPQT